MTATLPDIASVTQQSSGQLAVTFADGTQAPLAAVLSRLYGANGNPILPNADGSMNVIQAAIAAIALTAPAANLTASVDTPFTFASQVRHVEVWNKSATPVYVEYDAAASVGSRALYSTERLFMDVPVATVHLYSIAATPVNGTADSNIVLKGWS